MQPTIAHPTRPQERPQERPSGPRSAPTAPAPHPDTLRFLDVLYHGLAGWCELSYIDGDPSDRTAPFVREWHHVAGEYQALASRCTALGARYGNVYASRTLYSVKRRSEAHALPSRVIFIDDLPAAPALPPSMAVQTSATSRHGYYLASESLPNADGADLARRGAAALGADRSGADLVQIVRVPGTFNTKRGGRWPVQLVTTDGPRYTAAELGAAWPALPEPAASWGGLDERRVGWWLGNIGLLLDQEGLPRRVRNPKARARFAQRGEWRDSSAYRFTIARSLVMHGFPDDEAAALLLHFCDDGGQRKGGRWLAGDVARCLAKVRAEVTPYQGIRPTTMSTKYQARLPQALPSNAPRRKGRPVALAADQLLAFYRQHADTATHCMMSRADVAQALHISTGVLGRLERQLLERGELYRETAANRRRSWIVFGAKPTDLGMIKNAENAENQAATIVIFDDTSSAAGSHKPGVLATKEHTPPIAPAPAAASGASCPPAAALPGPGALPSGAVCSSKKPPAQQPTPAESYPGSTWIEAGPPSPPAAQAAQASPRAAAPPFAPGAPIRQPVTASFARQALKTASLASTPPARYQGAPGPNSAALAILRAMPGYGLDQPAPGQPAPSPTPEHDHESTAKPRLLSLGGPPAGPAGAADQPVDQAADGAPVAGQCASA